MDHIALHILLFQTSLKNSCIRATGCGVSGARRKEKEHQRFGKIFLHWVNDCAKMVNIWLPVMGYCLSWPFAKYFWSSSPTQLISTCIQYWQSVVFSASAHITCRSPDEYMNIANKIKRFFHNEGIHSTTIQPEFVVENETDSQCALECGKDDNCAAQKCCPGENETEMRKRGACLTDGKGELINHETMV